MSGTLTVSRRLSIILTISCGHVLVNLGLSALRCQSADHQSVDIFCTIIDYTVGEVG